VNTVLKEFVHLCLFKLLHPLLLHFSPPEMVLVEILSSPPLLAANLRDLGKHRRFEDIHIGLFFLLRLLCQFKAVLVELLGAV